MSNNYRTLIKNKNKIDRIIKNIQSNSPVNENNVISITHNANQNNRTFLVNRKASSDVASNSQSTNTIDYIPRMFIDRYDNDGDTVINLASQINVMSKNELKKIFNNKYKYFEVIDNKLLGFDQNTYNMNNVGYSYGNDGHKDLSLTQFFSDLDYNYLAEMYINNECNENKLSSTEMVSNNISLPTLSYNQPILCDSDNNTDIKLFIGNYNNGIRCNKSDKANLKIDFVGITSENEYNYAGRTRNARLYYAAGAIIEKDCVRSNRRVFDGLYTGTQFVNSNGSAISFTRDELAFGLTGGKIQLYKYITEATIKQTSVAAFSVMSQSYIRNGPYDYSIFNSFYNYPLIGDEMGGDIQEPVYDSNLTNPSYTFKKMRSHFDGIYSSYEVQQKSNEAAFIAGLIYNTIYNNLQKIISVNVNTTTMDNSSTSASSGGTHYFSFYAYGKKSVTHKSSICKRESVSISGTSVYIYTYPNDFEIGGYTTDNLEGDNLFDTISDYQTIAYDTIVQNYPVFSDESFINFKSKFVNNAKNSLWSRLDYVSNIKNNSWFKNNFKTNTDYDFIKLNNNIDNDICYTSLLTMTDIKFNPFVNIDDKIQFVSSEDPEKSANIEALDLSNFGIQFVENPRITSDIWININPYTFNNYVYDNINTKISNLCQYNNISDKSKIDFINKYRDKHFYNNQLKTKVSYLKNNDNLFNINIQYGFNRSYDQDTIEFGNAFISDATVRHYMTPHVQYMNYYGHNKVDASKSGTFHPEVNDIIKERWLDPLNALLQRELEAELRGLG
jgi:hypothetical protein